jgi:hypothetical protein
MTNQNLAGQIISLATSQVDGDKELNIFTSALHTALESVTDANVLKDVAIEVLNSIEGVDQEDLGITDTVAAIKQFTTAQTPSKGEAVVSAAMNIDGIPHVCVGIVGSSKVISICGVSGAADEAESLANAHRIANDWNKVV